MIAPDWTSDSPNFNPFPPFATSVVIHATRSGVSMNPRELEGTLNWFKRADSQVSSHWVIGRNGEKVRVIEDDWQAWHAGRHNGVAFGIELCQGVEADGFTTAQMKALVAVCRGYVEDFGIPPRFVNTVEAGGFLGHEDTAQGMMAGKSDPGRLFDWDLFIRMLKEEDMVEKYIVRLVSRQGNVKDYALWNTGELTFLHSPEHRDDLVKVYEVNPVVVQLGPEAAATLGVPSD